MSAVNREASRVLVVCNVHIICNKNAYLVCNICFSAFCCSKPSGSYIVQRRLFGNSGQLTSRVLIRNLNIHRTLKLMLVLADLAAGSCKIYVVSARKVETEKALFYPI